MEEPEQAIGEGVGTQMEPEELVRLERRLRKTREALERLDPWLNSLVEPLPIVVMED